MISLIFKICVLLHLYMIVVINKKMKTRIILIISFVISQISWTQNSNHKIRIISNELNGMYEFVEETEFKKHNLISEKFLDFIPEKEQNISRMYPEFFKLKDSCYYFKKRLNSNINDHRTILKACNKFGNFDKESLSYKFEGIFFNNVLIEVSGYEYWGYISVSLEDGLAFYTMGKPLSSKGETAISYSNYYGEEEIALTDLENKKQYVIGIEGWRTLESYVKKDIYYLKLEPDTQPNHTNEFKYLKLQIKNQS